MIKFLALLVCIKLMDASFCGESLLPYHLISSKNDLILGCAKPTCLNFPPGSSSNFTSLEDGYFDGFKTSPKSSQNGFNIAEKIDCDKEFGVTKCEKEGEWVGGIRFRSSNSSEKLLFRCCRNSAMKNTVFQQNIQIKLNEEFKNGGDIYEKGKLIGFDYIKNIVKLKNEEGINYELIVNRILCNSNNILLNTTATTPTTTKKNGDNKNVDQKPKLYQALTSEVENPIDLNSANAANNFNSLQNQNAQFQGSRPSATCSNIQILTNSGRGIDLPITQTTTTNAGIFTIDVTCTSPNLNDPIALNWFEQTQGRGISNGIGRISRNLTCTNEGQLLLPPEGNSFESSIVDQVECITSETPAPPLPPLQQYYPVQFQQAAQPGAVGGAASPASAYLCFSADTFVTTIEGKKKRMEKLEINDWVLSGNSKNGKIGYSKVSSWIHKKPNLMAEFLKFTLKNGKSLKISKKHYIHKCNCNEENTTNSKIMQMIYAENVSLNDRLFVLNKNNELIKTRILKIELIKEKGIYSPLTENGNIFVNDILASCYSNIYDKSVQKSYPSFTEKVKTFLSSFGLHHLSSSSSSTEKDLIPGFNLLIDILKNVLPNYY